MLTAPSWHGTVRIMQSDLIFVPIALSYLYLLIHSWQPDTLQLVLPGSLEAGLSGCISNFHRASPPYLFSVEDNVIHPMAGPEIQQCMIFDEAVASQIMRAKCNLKICMPILNSWYSQASAEFHMCLCRRL